jgi:hypothetical protein
MLRVGQSLDLFFLTTAMTLVWWHVVPGDAQAVISCTALMCTPPERAQELFIPAALQLLLLQHV